MVDLRWYDLIVLNTSGGKDSLAMMDFLARECRRQKVLDRVLPVHAELGKVVWPGTTELTRCQARYYGLPPVVVVERETGDLLQHVKDRGRWPSFKYPFCTSEHKHNPTNTQAISPLVDQWCQTHRSGCHDRPFRVLSCMGLRAHESPRRAKMIAYENQQENSRRILHRWLPIFDWTVDKVWQVCERSGAPLPRTYERGQSRFSCVFCINSNFTDHMLAAREHPELARAYVAVEKKIGWAFTQARSMSEVIEWSAAGLKKPPRGKDDALDGVVPCPCDLGW